MKIHDSAAQLAPAVLAALVATFAGCVSDKYTEVDKLPEQALAPAPYRIQPGDKLAIAVWNQTNLSGDHIVRPDGNITLPLAGDVAVGGLTPPACSKEIARRMQGLVLDPKVSVSVAGTREASVSVLGEVRDAGAYPLKPGEGVLEILARAGGLSEFADRDRIFVIRKKGEPIRVRFQYAKLVRQEGAGVAFNLQDGDVVVVE
jgi:polysaccharide biosynthesis/export protein